MSQVCKNEECKQSFTPRSRKGVFCSSRCRTGQHRIDKRRGWCRDEIAKSWPDKTLNHQIGLVRDWGLENEIIDMVSSHGHLATQAAVNLIVAHLGRMSKQYERELYLCGLEIKRLTEQANKLADLKEHIRAL